MYIVVSHGTRIRLLCNDISSVCYAIGTQYIDLTDNAGHLMILYFLLAVQLTVYPSFSKWNNKCVLQFSKKQFAFCSLRNSVWAKSVCVATQERLFCNLIPPGSHRNSSRAKSCDISSAYSFTTGCLIVLRCCIDLGSDTTVLCTTFQINWETEIVVLGEQCFTRFELSFWGRLYCNRHLMPCNSEVTLYSGNCSLRGYTPLSTCRCYALLSWWLV